MASYLMEACLRFLELRYDAVAEINKQRGISKENYTIIRTATKEFQDAVGHQHRDWMDKIPEDSVKMDVPNIKL